MMPLHQRRKPEQGKQAEAESNGSANDHISMSADRPSSTSTGRRSMGFIGLLALQLVMMFYAASHVKTKSMNQFALVLGATWIASLPIVLSLAVGLGLFSTPADFPHQRYIPLVVVATIFGTALPVFLSSGFAGCGIVLFGLSSRPIARKDDDAKQETKQSGSLFQGPLGTVLAVILMTTVLLTENFFIWVVSATYEESQNLHTLPSPLQDNGQIVLRHLFGSILELTKREVATLRHMINVQWILVSGMGLSLVTAELQGEVIGRNLWSLGLRALFTLTIARCIRTISFLITVLPSQNPRCYFSHFPLPPPQEWFAWLMVGFIPQANGGCNDLIISGHATVTSTLACVITSVVNKPLFTVALWMFVAMDYMVEIYEGFHYSVDMWLGAVLVNLIWTALKPVEGQARLTQNGSVASQKFRSLQDTTRSDLITYSLPAVGSYVQVNGVIPYDLANYTIVLYIGIVAFQISRFGFQHYTQHMLFCLLFVALGIYL
jgi:hypothetical protein